MHLLFADGDRKNPLKGFFLFKSLSLKELLKIALRM